MAPFTKAANRAIPARKIAEVSREGIFSFSNCQRPITWRCIIAQRVITRMRWLLDFAKGQETVLALADAIRSRPAPKKVVLVVSLVEEKARRGRVHEIAGGPGRTRTCNQTVMSGRL